MSDGEEHPVEAALREMADEPERHKATLDEPWEAELSAVAAAARYFHKGRGPDAEYLRSVLAARAPLEAAEN